MPFTALNLDPEILKVLAESGYSKPTPIQENAIPKILEGCDLLASAQTGSGKTAAFILPALNRLKNNAVKTGAGPRILVLVPTRELAMQVATQAVKYSKYLPKIKTVCLYGGAPYPVQNRQLARPYEILVATPGRLIDHLESGRIDFSRMELFILDEADRMLDMGFISAVERISAALPKKVQTVLFSATLENEIVRLSKNLLTSPVEINLASNKKKHDNIEQVLFWADNLDHKLRLLDHLLKDETMKQAIIFTSTKFFANELTQILKQNGHYAGVLHGDLNQRQRTNTTRQLREGKISILVATDVAARGIDIPAITHVVNFDLPMNIEDYVHRIGRTGRADAKGIAFSLALFRDKSLVERIEKFTGIAIERKEVAGMEPTSKPSKQPSRRSGPSQRSRRPARSEGENTSRPRFEKRPFEKPSNEQSFFAKSRDEKRSFDRPRTQRETFDRPRREQKTFERPRAEKAGSDQPHHEKKSFDRPYKEKSFDRPRAEKAGFDQPYREKRSFDRPYKEKSFDRPRAEKKSFGKPQSEGFSGQKSQKRPFESKHAPQRSRHEGSYRFNKE